MKKTDISQILNEGVDVTNRRIYFGSMADKSSDFDWTSVEHTIRALHYLSAESSEPIELHMSSTGGAEYDMSRLYDTIQTCPVPVIFIGSGYIMSAAVWIMSACDYRMLHENTEIMVHEGSGGMDESATHVDQEIILESNKKRNSKWWDILASNSRLPKSFWEAVGKRDLYLDADEAVELGLADKVIRNQDRSQFRELRNKVMNRKMPKAKATHLVDRMLSRVKQESLIIKVK